MKPIEPVTVVIADDHDFFRTGFKNIIENQYAGQIKFMGEAKNGVTLLETVACCQPKVVITDIQMPCMNGIEACKKIKQAHPGIAVIAFSMFTDTMNIMGMIQAGASGYLVKTSNHEEVLDAIKTVSRHESYYCSTISDKLFGTLVNSNLKRKKKELIFGEQEKKVMKLICRQQSTKEIAGQLKLATRTVENYKSNIMEKIGARNVVGIALFAVINEIVKLSEFL